jgi:hypothetical protein
MKRLLASRGAPVALVTVVTLLAGAGGGYALASGSSTTITVCVSHKGGGLYKAKRCKKRDSRLSWNQTGPQGVQGVQGIQGQKGDAGPPGVPSVTEASSAAVTITHGDNGTAEADCPSGTVATGGGGVNVNPSVYLVTDAPADAATGATPTAWLAGFQNNSGSTVTVYAIAICTPTG